MTRPIDTSLEQRLPLGTDLALRRQFMVVNEPLPGNLRFGRLLEVLDALAEEAALRHVRGAAPQAYVVTAAIDQVVLRTPADVPATPCSRRGSTWWGGAPWRWGSAWSNPASNPRTWRRATSRWWHAWARGMRPRASRSSRSNIRRRST